MSKPARRKRHQNKRTALHNSNDKQNETHPDGSKSSPGGAHAHLPRRGEAANKKHCSSHSARDGNSGSSDPVGVEEIFYTSCAYAGECPFNGHFHRRAGKGTRNNAEIRIKGRRKTKIRYCAKPGSNEGCAEHAHLEEQQEHVHTVAADEGVPMPFDDHNPYDPDAVVGGLDGQPRQPPLLTPSQWQNEEFADNCMLEEPGPTVQASHYSVYQPSEPVQILAGPEPNRRESGEEKLLRLPQDPVEPTLVQSESPDLAHEPDVEENRLMIHPSEEPELFEVALDHVQAPQPPPGATLGDGIWAGYYVDEKTHLATSLDGSEVVGYYGKFHQMRIDLDARLAYNDIGLPTTFIPWQMYTRDYTLYKRPRGNQYHRRMWDRVKDFTAGAVTTLPFVDAREITDPDADRGDMGTVSKSSTIMRKEYTFFGIPVAAGTPDKQACSIMTEHGFTHMSIIEINCHLWDLLMEDRSIYAALAVSNDGSIRSQTRQLITAVAGKLCESDPDLPKKTDPVVYRTVLAVSCEKIKIGLTALQLSTNDSKRPDFRPTGQV